MARVSFYFNVQNHDLALCQLANKALNRGLTLGILTGSISASAAMDTFLWQVPDIGFLPHCVHDHPLAEHTPVLIAHSIAHIPERNVLFNASGQPCGQPERFDRVIEIVALDDIPARDLARERARQYRSQGLTVDFTDMAASRPG
ncbi:DNA polymerase III subunit chi [Burkholderiaceae bacterium DAT-1]|nr:DNA polymerase III subunit chi [Burkholderiaceae bacterium DAT-1]